MKQLESWQAKTNVEHVHVLEEAKRVTDRQLFGAHVELQRNTSYPLTREVQSQTCWGSRGPLKGGRTGGNSEGKGCESPVEKLSRALTETREVGRTKVVAELQCRRQQSDIQALQHQLAQAQDQVVVAQKSKDNLETELSTIGDKTETSN